VAGIIRSAGWACTVLDENIELFRSVSTEDRVYWLAEPLSQGVTFSPDASRPEREGCWRDASFIEWFLKRYGTGIKDRLRSLDGAVDHHLVAFTVNMDSRLLSLFATRFLKDCRPDRPVLFGGPDCYLLEYNKQFLIHDRGPDIVCQGEAELCLPRFLREFGTTGDFRTSVRGFAYRDSGTTVDTGEPDLPNLQKDFVLPDWSQFDFAKYEQPGDFGATFSRGCPNKCAFCAPRPTNNRYRKRNAEQVLDEIKSAMKHCRRYADQPTVHFSDSLMNGDITELERLCHEIGASGLGIRWRGFVRFNQGMSAALLRKMKMSGCTHLFWGLESAGQRVITLMGKKFDLDLAKRIAQDALQAGITCHYSMIVGFPGETPKDVGASIAFVCQFRGRICFPGPYKLMIVPGSPLHEHPSRWGVGEIRKESWVSVDLRNDGDVRLLRQFIVRNAIHNDSLSLHDVVGWKDVDAVDFNRAPVAADIAGILYELWRIAGTESIMTGLLTTWQGDLLTERLEPQPNGDCRHRRHVRPWVSQVPSYYAGDPDVAPGFQGQAATKLKFRSQFPKKSSRQDKNFRDSSTDPSGPEDLVYWHPAGISQTHSLENWFSRDKNSFEQRSRICTFLLEAIRAVRTTCDASKEVSA
jgi:hypothetical protein